jgi:hypothetical protein
MAKFDENKTPFGLVPPEALAQIADVLGFGAEKYGVNNWRVDGPTTSWVRTYSSVQRHLNKWHAGEDIDPESGYTHLSHAATQIMILMMHAIEHPEVDDRYGK